MAFDINSGALNQIRSLFESVLHLQDNDSGIESFQERSLSHCPTVWRLYLRFEVSELLENQINQIDISF